MWSGLFGGWKPDAWPIRVGFLGDVGVNGEGRTRREYPASVVEITQENVPSLQGHDGYDHAADDKANQVAMLPRLLFVFPYTSSAQQRLAGHISHCTVVFLRVSHRCYHEHC